MKRIAQLFKQGKAFVGYLTIGDGGIEKSLMAAKALIAGGVNVLELGVPFSDPIADGPVIQQAAERALQAKTTLKDVLHFAKELRQHTMIPFILFTYFNPLLAHQPQDIFKQIKAAGIDGILVVDLPPEEAVEHQKQCLAADLAPIYIISAVTPAERIKRIAKLGRGFLYYACRKGTTGVRNELPAELTERIQLIKSLTSLPVVVGFGIADASASTAICKIADGFVVGSRLVQAVADGKNSNELQTLCESLLPPSFVSDHSNRIG